MMNHVRYMKPNCFKALHLYLTVLWTRADESAIAYATACVVY